MSFPSNCNKYNFKPRNEQNNRFIFKQAKWDEFSWLFTAIPQASSLLFFFSELPFRYVET